MESSVKLRERLAEDAAESIVKYFSAPSFQKALKHEFYHQFRIHLAHVWMLSKQQIISEEDCRRIMEALLSIRAAGPEKMVYHPHLDCLYSHIEAQLVQMVGPEVGGRLHTARSRNDLGATLGRMACREILLEVMTELNSLREVVINLAEEYHQAVMPGVTHWQQAQPITLGYYFAAWSDVLARDFERLEMAYGSTNMNPLGAAALTTTGFPIDRMLTTQLLGFDNVVENAYDAICSFNYVPEVACTLAVMGTHLSRLIEDLGVWSTSEYGYVELADRYCTVSSIMPQKKNPVCLEHLRTVVGAINGNSVGILANRKNAPFNEASDAITPKRAMDSLELARDFLILLRGILQSITIKTEVMAESCLNGNTTMTAVADSLVRKCAISFREAHNIVAHAARQLAAEGKTASDLTAAQLKGIAQESFNRKIDITDVQVRQALDPAADLVARQIADQTNRLAQCARQQLSASRGCVAACRKQLTEADEQLEAQVQLALRSAEER